MFGSWVRDRVFGAEGLGLMVVGLTDFGIVFGAMKYGLGFRVWGLGFGVKG